MLSFIVRLAAFAVGSLIGKWLAAKMSVTPIDGGSSWTVEGSVNGFSIQYGRE